MHEITLFARSPSPSLLLRKQTTVKPWGMHSTATSRLRTLLLPHVSTVRAYTLKSIVATSSYHPK